MILILLKKDCTPSCGYKVNIPVNFLCIFKDKVYLFSGSLIYKLNQCY